MEAQRGRVIGGRYQLVKALHTGGFGRVWQAHDRHRGEDVAVKEVWLPPGLSDAERADRLVRAEREARNAAQLRHHPNIVAVRDVVTEDGVPWIVMRLVTGHSLAEDLDAVGPLSAGQAAYVADNLLKALGAAHGSGIVHRDVKPANVMFTDAGEVLLTDFGIAVHEADTTLTATGMLVGSVDYMAPERVRGENGDAAGDMFSLGVTLYQAVTGVSPFHRDTVAASLAAVLFQEPPPPSSCPAGLSSLIMRLMAKDPRQRPTVPLARGLLAALPAAGATARSDTTPANTHPKPTLVETRKPTLVETRKPTLVEARTPKPTLVEARKPAPVAAPPRPARVAPRQPAPPRSIPTAARKPARQRPPRPRVAVRPRRRRRVPVFSIAALVMLGLLGVHAAWGRDADGATAGDCVYHRQQGWHLEPCALPVPWRDTANYKVLDRVEGTAAECGAVPGWSVGDGAAELPGDPPVTLCLAPIR